MRATQLSFNHDFNTLHKSEAVKTSATRAPWFLVAATFFWERIHTSKAPRLGVGWAKREFSWPGCVRMRALCVWPGSGRCRPDPGKSEAAIGTSVLAFTCCPVCCLGHSATVPAPAVSPVLRFSLPAPSPGDPRSW